MNRQQLFEQMRAKKSFLCVGLDTDVDHKDFPSDEVLEAYAGTGIMNDTQRILYFNRAIIDATHDLAVAYKMNLWFYLARGAAGMAALERTIDYIKEKDERLFVIVDAKVGDIGNTSRMAAQAFLENHQADAVTINPYMGEDVAEPFMEYEDCWVIILALTSNKSAEDFQFTLPGGKRTTFFEDTSDEELFSTGSLYGYVLKRTSRWGTPDNTMYVIGATKPEQLGEIRQQYPGHFFLVPGIGAQGGDLEAVAKNGLNGQCGLLVNNSRGIIFAGNGDAEFGADARNAAQKTQTHMEELMLERGLIG